VSVWKNGGWVQVTDYQVCLTRRCWWRGSARCAVERWPGDRGGAVEKIPSSYWLEETGETC